jgi:hypothetical protein
MPTSTENSTTEPAATTTNPNSSIKSASTTKATDPQTLWLLTEIEIERDYYHSCGRW